MFYTIVISILIAGAAAGIIASKIKKKGNGCGCGCKGCSMSDICHNKK